MSLIDQVEVSIATAIQKGIKAAGTAVAAYATTMLMKKLGMQLSVDQQLMIAGVVTGLLTTARNFAKTKFPKQLGWL